MAIAIAAFVAVSGPSAASEPVLRGDGGVPDFYSWQKPLPPKPGKLLRQEALFDKTVLENAGRAVRILYASTDGLGGEDRVPVSGALYLPKGKAPKGGWPLLAWAHGTVGIGDMCAPSFAGRSPRDITYLNFWLAKGYAVVASDYQGLGTPGGHPYLATRPVAYSVLDSIRAVQGKTFGIGKRTVLIGQSQGGGAAFSTAGIAPIYAPELDIAGTVATGTPYFRGDLEAALDAARPADMIDPLLAYNFYFLSLQEQVDPAFRIEDHVTDKAMPVAKAAATQCFLDVARASVGAGLTRANAFKAEPLGGLPAAVASRDDIIVIDDDRHQKAEALNIGGELGELLARMFTRIARIGDERCRRQHRDIGVVGKGHHLAPFKRAHATTAYPSAFDSRKGFGFIRSETMFSMRRSDGGSCSNRRSCSCVSASAWCEREV